MSAAVKKINSRRTETISDSNSGASEKQEDLKLSRQLREVVLGYRHDPEAAATTLTDPLYIKQKGLRTNGHEYYQILPNGDMRPVDNHTYWGVLERNEKAILHEGTGMVEASVRRTAGRDMELVLSADDIYTDVKRAKQAARK